MHESCSGEDLACSEGSRDCLSVSLFPARTWLAQGLLDLAARHMGQCEANICEILPWSQRFGDV